MDPAEYIRQYGARCEVVHLKDFVMEGDPKNLYQLIGTEVAEEEGGEGFFQFRPVGFGQMIWEPILEAALEAGSKWVIVEQDEHYGLGALEAARRSREYLRILGW
ncbi:MAG: sugar phosphate isomerase/epimerase [Firmicutes bacterium]|nr:sugar phosphate isomerase/epimerase [Bacillota bacterium]